MKNLLSALLFGSSLFGLFGITHNVSAATCTDFGGAQISSITRQTPAGEFVSDTIPHAVSGTEDFIYDVAFTTTASDITAEDFVVATTSGVVSTGPITVSKETGTTVQVIVPDVDGTGTFSLRSRNEAECDTTSSVVVARQFSVNQIPSVINVTSPMVDGEYGPGDNILINVQFSEIVKFHKGFNAVLDLAVGSNRGVATLVESPFGIDTLTNTLTFNYMVGQGDMAADLQYEDVSALVPTAGAATDPVTLAPASIVLPSLVSPATNSLAANKNISLKPTQSATSTVSTNVVTGPTITITASAPVIVANTNDGPRMTFSDQTYCPAIESYWKKGDRDPEIRKIQMFLNVYERNNLTVDGIYGVDTYDAVRAFQVKYAAEILAPWGLDTTEATGNWYKTTSKLANYLVGCDVGGKRLDNGVVVRSYIMPPKQHEPVLSQPFDEVLVEKYSDLLEEKGYNTEEILDMVSKVSMSQARSGTETGVVIEVSGDRQEKINPANVPVGTTVIIPR